MSSLTESVMSWNELLKNPREATPGGPLKAYCTSTGCDQTNKLTGSGTLKEGIPEDAVFCLDCGHALYWTRR